MSSHRFAIRLITAMCVAEVFSMIGVFAFPALLPRFFEAWALTHTEAGWINGIFFAGYTITVPILASLTDRVDARPIYLASATVSAAACLGFALLAQGFWTALLFRTLGGVGLAGTFIPGLKVLVDRLEGAVQARAISFYTATFSLGTSGSFLAAGQLEMHFGWRIAFAVAAAGAGVALVLAAAVTRSRPPRPSEIPGTRLMDFRPVLHNRKALTYILAYAAHMWELFSFRSWMVAFLAFSLGMQPTKGGTWSPSVVVALTSLVAMWASVGGAELAIRFGRTRVLSLVMGGSALFGCAMGFTASLPYSVVATLCVVYALFVQGDSAALHIGTVQSADPNRRGAAMAVQSLLGFGSASLGPIAVGTVLDLTGGGQTVMSWGIGFMTMGIGVGMGPVILRILRPETEAQSAGIS